MLRQYVQSIRNLDYQDEELLSTFVDYFIYVALLSTNSLEDAMDVLNSLISDLK